MLGLAGANIAPSITLNTSYGWSSGQDAINTLEHEISEAMGRIGGLGDQNDVWSTMDLFRYSSAQVPDYQNGVDNAYTYFSSDGGKTLSALSFHNEYDGFIKEDTEDTADFTQQDVFGTVSVGETNQFSQTDFDVMDALGWDQADTNAAVAEQSFRRIYIQRMPATTKWSSLVATSRTATR